MVQEATLVDKSAGVIREMFAGVAPRYDLLNHLLSGGLDLWWRRRAAASLALSPGSRAVDLCAGTGDQSLALARRGARVAAADFCLPMLTLAQRKFAAGTDRRPSALAADALSLPFGGDSFQGATVAFGLRNVADLDRALTELVRVLAPGGGIAVLEFALPRRQPWRALYLFYFSHFLPLIGRLISRHRSAYGYLPSSVLSFPQRGGFLACMARAGFEELASEDLAGGVVCLYRGRKPR